MIIDTGLVHRLIDAQFPEWADLPVIPVEPHGRDNHTFRLGDRMSVRLPSAEAYVAQVEKEHRWLPLLQPGLPLPIPEPLARGAPGPGYPWPWSVYRWLDGRPAADERITDPIEFARSLADFLVSLHRIDATGGPAPGQHNFKRGGPLAVYDSETRAALSALQGRVDIVAAEKVWTAALGSQWLRPAVWVHGDIASDNLLVKKGKLCAVIDFGCLAVGDPACDLVIAWTDFSNRSRETFRAALPLDDNAWARARGWALWKALITAANQDNDQRAVQRSRRVIAEVVADHQ
ncbi:MAG: aminoglycoside phosphotransferase family protein [Candidatus Acidiferrales bacterium]